MLMICKKDNRGLWVGITVADGEATFIAGNGFRKQMGNDSLLKNTNNLL